MFVCCFRIVLFFFFGSRARYSRAGTPHPAFCRTVLCLCWCVATTGGNWGGICNGGRSQEFCDTMTPRLRYFSSRRIASHVQYTHMTGSGGHGSKLASGDRRPQVVTEALIIAHSERKLKLTNKLPRSFLQCGLASQGAIDDRDMP